MLRVPELQRPASQWRVVHRLQGARGGARVAVEDLCDDGLARRVCAGAEADYRSDEQAAVAEHVEYDELCDEGVDCGADRTADVRGGDADGLFETARPGAGGDEDDSRADLHGAAGRVLRVSECE